MTPLISSYPSWHYTFSTMKQHFFSVDTALFYLITRILLIISSFNRAVATNSGPGGGVGWRFRFKSGPFLYRKCKRGIKECNVSSPN